MKQSKHIRKSRVHNLCAKCPPFRRTHALKWLCHRAIAPWWWSGPAPAAFTPAADVHSTPLHHGSTNRYLRHCSPPDSNPANWVATSLGDELWSFYL